MSTCDYYYDKMYLLPYTSFVSLPSGVFIFFDMLQTYILFGDGLWLRIYIMR